MKRGVTHTVWVLVSVLAVAGWIMMLRPTSLGGPAGYVMVRGTSMLPTYASGDLVITRSSASYEVGDSVAYRVPDGDVGEGIVVIHRIIGGSPEEGFVLQGDNNEVRDDWNPKPHDIVGKEWVRIPKLGVLLAFLHSPLPLASLAAVIAIVFVLFPRKPKEQVSVS